MKAQDAGVGSLTKTEYVRWSAWHTAIALRMQNQFNDYHLGYLDEVSYQAMLRAAARFYPLWQALEVEMEDFDPKFAQTVRAVAEQQRSE